MHRSKLIQLLILLTLSSACSDRGATPPPIESAPPSSTSTALVDANDNALRARLNASGVPAEYAAHFENDQLVRISEQRKASDTASHTGEYVFKGARLIAYRGAKLGGSMNLDLQFDTQGALQSGQGPDVTDEDVSAIRGRAELLRSHALAQRATRLH